MTSFTVIVKTRGVATTFLSDFASSVHGARLLLSEGGKRVRSLGFTRPSCIFSMDLSQTQCHTDKGHRIGLKKSKG